MEDRFEEIRRLHQEVRSVAFEIIKDGDFAARAELAGEWEELRLTVDQVEMVLGRTLQGDFDEAAIDSLIKKSQEEG